MQRLPLSGFVILLSVAWSSAFIAGKLAIAELDRGGVLSRSGSGPMGRTGRGCVCHLTGTISLRSALFEASARAGSP